MPGTTAGPDSGQSLTGMRGNEPLRARRRGTARVVPHELGFACCTRLPFGSSLGHGTGFGGKRFQEVTSFEKREPFWFSKMFFYKPREETVLNPLTSFGKR